MLKKTILALLLLALLFGITTICKGAQIPELIDNDFLANGTEITISERQDGQLGAKITWKTGTLNINENTKVYGGGKATTEIKYETSNIIMNGGTVKSIYGGGKGTTTVGSNIGTSNITMNGGTVKETLYGGGFLTSKVENVNVTITGGQIYAVVGGGNASSTEGSVGTKSAPEKSPCIANNVKINITGGTILDSSKKYGLLYGGGQGYSYTKNVVMNISGTANLKSAWVVAGGSNGRTDNSTINVKDVEISVIQTINRGSMINANVIINSGNVKTLYAGGEDAETFSNDIVNGGFLGNIMLDIKGGNGRQSITRF